MARFDYESLAQQAILEILRTEHAATWPEIEAKAADRRLEGLPLSINPHHLTNARRALVKSGRIVEVTETSHGGHQVTILCPADTKGRSGAIRDAAKRKRSLTASLHGWGTATVDKPEGLLGPAGEKVVHASLLEAGRYGFHPINPDTGRIAGLFGNDIPGGPLDNAAYLHRLDPQSRPMPPVFIPIEVKNVRHWLYPNAREPYQLLFKSSRLQEIEPDLRMAPLLTCRRKNFQLNQMAYQLGFRVIDTRKQYLLDDPLVKTETLKAIQAELGFTDLVQLEGSDEAILGALSSFQKEAHGLADRWKAYGSQLAEHYEDLRDDSLGRAARVRAVDDLREAARELLESDGEEIDRW